MAGLSHDQREMLEHLARKYLYPKKYSIRLSNQGPGRWAKRGMAFMAEADDILYQDNGSLERKAMTGRIYARSLLANTAWKKHITVKHICWRLDDLIQDLAAKLAGAVGRGARIPRDERGQVNYLLTALRNLRKDVYRHLNTGKGGELEAFADLRATFEPHDLIDLIAMEERAETEYLECEGDYLPPIKSNLLVGGVGGVEPSAPSFTDDDNGGLDDGTDDETNYADAEDSQHEHYPRDAQGPNRRAKKHRQTRRRVQA